MTARRTAIASTLATLATLALATVGGCANDDADRTLTVLAASSLSEPFTTLAAEFEAAHPGVRVRLVLESSATLAQLATERAPGEVLATADRRTMEQAEDDGGTAGAGTQFASNVLVLAVPKANPARVGSVDDLDREDVDYLTCVSSAPCGATAGVLLRANDVRRPPVSLEVDVKAVLTKLEESEADAGLVYRSDVTASDGAVTAIDLPGAAEHPNSYWVAPTARAGDSELAREWITLLTGDDGRRVLTAAGFGA